MQVAEIHFRRTGMRASSKATDAIQSLLAAWRLNGQVLERAHPIVKGAGGYRAYVMVPERTALAARWANEWVRRALAQLEDARLQPPSIRILGPEASADDEDRCKRRPSFILFTTFLAVESPFRCGNCFRPVPLYRIQPTAGGEYHDIMSWQSSYQACDTLQMGCTVGERFGTKELSGYDSRLARMGRDICARVEAATKLPTYYYLYRGSGRSLMDEKARRCPSCGRTWILRSPWHRIFTFRCERCRLVSNIAWDVKH